MTKHVIFLTPTEQLLGKEEKIKIIYQRLRCLIVGNEKNILRTSLGEKIDFSFFERMNNVIEKGRKIRGRKNETPKSLLRRQRESSCKTARYNRLYEIFGYDDFSKASKNDATWYNKNKFWYDVFLLKNNNMDWNIKCFCEKLQIDVCPYCNRQYIYTYEKNLLKRNTAEIDHFRPKSKYPYLSCSLFNLVPACHTCNSVKLAVDEKKIIYPYTECFGENGKFQIQRGSSQELEIPINVRKIKVNIKIVEHAGCVLNSKIEASKKVFHLEEIYTKHQLDVCDLLFRYNRYGKMKIKDVANTLDIPELAVKKIILGIPIRIDKKKEFVLHKFKKDVIDQLDEINKNKCNNE